MNQRHRRTNVLTTGRAGCLAPAEALGSIMDQRNSSPLFYPPQYSPQRHQAAIAFIRSVNRYFRVTPADRTQLWETYLPIGDRLLATSWRYARPQHARLPYQFAGSVATKAEAKQHLQRIRQSLTQYLVPACTQREYLKELFIVGACRVHRLIAELQKAGYLGGCGPLH